MTKEKIIYEIYDNDASDANAMYSNGPQLINMRVHYLKSGLRIDMTGIIYPNTPLDLGTITDQSVLGKLYTELKKHPVRRTSTLPGKYTTEATWSYSANPNSDDTAPIERVVKTFNSKGELQMEVISTRHAVSTSTFNNGQKKIVTKTPKTTTVILNGKIVETKPTTRQVYGLLWDPKQKSL